MTNGVLNAHSLCSIFHQCFTDKVHETIIQIQSEGNRKPSIPPQHLCNEIYGISVSNCCSQSVLGTYSEHQNRFHFDVKII